MQVFPAKRQGWNCIWEKSKWRTCCKYMWIKHPRNKVIAKWIQFVIFIPWKVPWKWIAFFQIYFVISLGLLYHMIRRDSELFANEAFTSSSIVSSKQLVRSTIITTWNKFITKLNLAHVFYHGLRSYLTKIRKNPPWGIFFIRLLNYEQF